MFFLLFCCRRVVFVEVNQPPVTAQAGSLNQTRSGGNLQHLVDGRRGIIHPCRTVRVEKGERESTRCNTGQHGTPPTQPRCVGASATTRARHVRCSQTSEERGSFLGEASSDLTREHNQTSPASVANQFWKRVSFGRLATRRHTPPTTALRDFAAPLVKGQTRVVSVACAGAVRQPRPRASWCRTGSQHKVHIPHVNVGSLHLPLDRFSLPRSPEEPPASSNEDARLRPI